MRVQGQRSTPLLMSTALWTQDSLDHNRPLSTLYGQMQQVLRSQSALLSTASGTYCSGTLKQQYQRVLEGEGRELLSQLSGVTRSAGGQLNSSGPSASQLQQLQMQLQLERRHAQATRQQLETAHNATRRTNTSSVTTAITQSTATTNITNTESSQQTLQNSQFLLTRLDDPKMSETERQSMESERADHSLFVQELLLSTLVREESSSSDKDDRGEMADFGAMGCIDIMPLDVALENLHLKESNKGHEPPPPPL
ncbi:PREDICTED: E3 ubiquitin-protein ligase KCMF1-like [Cercocebus atys]|uniref:E3 ubiquitin-protein ligase KCMF1-like n=1 Tax=Cercocebus atys TaxID=9531 RepID=UPI0005F46406|nr:PREDICTED: E3 ubiquitin-protein ligase KCMF1-like [Cercocebus atys]